MESKKTLSIFNIKSFKFTFNFEYELIDKIMILATYEIVVEIIALLIPN